MGEGVGEREAGEFAVMNEFGSRELRERSQESVACRLQGEVVAVEETSGCCRGLLVALAVEEVGEECAGQDAAVRHSLGNLTGNHLMQCRIAPGRFNCA